MPETTIRFSGLGVRNHLRSTRSHHPRQDSAGVVSSGASKSLGVSTLVPTPTTVVPSTAQTNVTTTSAHQAPAFTTLLSTDTSGIVHTSYIAPTPSYAAWKPTWPQGPEGPHRPPTYGESTAFTHHLNYVKYGLIGLVALSPFFFIAIAVPIYRAIWRWKTKRSQTSSLTTMVEPSISQPPKALTLRSNNSILSTKSNVVSLSRSSQGSQRQTGRHSVVSQYERGGPPMLTTYSVSNSGQVDFDDEESYPFIRPPALPVALQIGRKSPTPDQFRRFSGGTIRSNAGDFDMGRKTQPGLESFYMERETSQRPLMADVHESSPASPSEYPSENDFQEYLSR